MRRGEGKRQDIMRRAIAQSVYQRFRATLRGAVSSVTVLVTTAGQAQRSRALLVMSHRAGNKMRCSIDFRVLFFSSDLTAGNYRICCLPASRQPAARWYVYSFETEVITKVCRNI